MPNRLQRDFFNRYTLDVAKELIGKTLMFGPHQGIITETEAYRGLEDPASHAYRGKTPRTEVMFGPPGHTYVYFIYGMYHCLNFVTEPEGTAAGVLIRGLYIDNLHLNGPGKLCRHLAINRDHSGMDLTTSSEFYITDSSYELPIITTPRIGISRAQDWPWRFLATELPTNR